MRTARTGMTAALRPPGPPRPGPHLLPAVIFRRQLLGHVLPRPGDKGQAQHGHAPGAPESTEHRGWGWPPGPGLWAKRPRSWGAGVLSVLPRHAQPCLHPATLCHTPSGPGLAGQGGWRPLPARSPVGSPRSTGRETSMSPGRGGVSPGSHRLGLHGLRGRRLGKNQVAVGLAFVKGPPETVWGPGWYPKTTEGSGGTTDTLRGDLTGSERRSREPRERPRHPAAQGSQAGPPRHRPTSPPSPQGLGTARRAVSAPGRQEARRFHRRSLIWGHTGQRQHGGGPTCAAYTPPEPGESPAGGRPVSLPTHGRGTRTSRGSVTPLPREEAHPGRRRWQAARGWGMVMDGQWDRGTGWAAGCRPGHGWVERRVERRASGGQGPRQARVSDPSLASTIIPTFSRASWS